MNIEYVTGFFDADGSITLCKKSKSDKYKSIKIDFTNTEKDVLLNIQNFILKKYDIKGHITTKKVIKENHNLGYTLAYAYDHAYNLCKILHSIHPKKLHRISTILKYYKLVTKRNGKYSIEESTRKLAFERLFFSSIFQLRSDYIIIPTK